MYSTQVRSLSLFALLLALFALVVAAPAVQPVEAQSPDTDIFVAEVSVAGGAVSFSGWRNVTDRQGYDNQPSFTPDSRSLLYTAQSDGQTDIFRWDVDDGPPVQVTATP
ncbi:MAG: hypothetical protein OEU54_04765, partial [Gemmatimonadota bacterium]|nr:hypothetical protein [Gemmatimonadota bacterium]